MKIQISIDDELAERIDSYAKKTYTSRSGLISIACTQYLMASELPLQINALTHACRTIAEKNELDPDTIAQLQDFERFAKMLTGTK